MIKIHTILLFVLSAFLSVAQSLDITSQYRFGSAGDDDLFVCPSPNGDGYYLIGMSDGNTSFDKTEDSRGGYDIWVVKTDNNFDIEWDKTYGGDQDEFTNSVVVLDDRIIISSTSSSNTSGDKTMDLWGGGDIWNICIDLNGDLIWQYQYGGDSNEIRNDMILYSDSSVVMAIQSVSGISGNKTQGNYGFADVWLVEAAISDGHIIQQSNVGSSSSEVYPKLAISELNKIYMTCISGSGVADHDKTDPGFLNNDVWLTELDNSLEVVQDKCFGGNSLEMFVYITVDDNDAIILAVTTQSGVSGNKTAPRISTQMGGEDCWFIKVDQNFDIAWDKAYGGTIRQSAGPLFTLPTGEIVANCASNSNSGTGNKTSPYYGLYDTWILFLDTDGNDLLQSSFGGSGYDFGTILIHPTESDKFILRSYSNSPISGNKTVAPYAAGYDVWIGILDYDATASTLELIENEGISAFPNPSNGEVVIQFKPLKEKSTISFVTVDGKVLETVEMSEGTSSFTWQTAYKGMVFYAINGESAQLQGKLVFE